MTAGAGAAGAAGAAAAAGAKLFTFFHNKTVNQPPLLCFHRVNNDRWSFIIVIVVIDVVGHRRLPVGLHRHGLVTRLHLPDQHAADRLRQLPQPEHGAGGARARAEEARRERRQCHQSADRRADRFDRTKLVERYDAKNARDANSDVNLDVVRATRPLPRAIVRPVSVSCMCCRQVRHAGHDARALPAAGRLHLAAGDVLLLRLDADAVRGGDGG